MLDKKKFLIDAGIKDLPFPIKVISGSHPEGQPTVANLSINARIMQEFEASWIDRFIHVVHSHKGTIGTATLAVNVLDYLKELKANMVKIDFDYPYFIEKNTPVSKEKCLVRYLCTYSVKVLAVDEKPKVFFRIEIPVVTTYPGSKKDKAGGLFGQLSVVTVEVETKKDLFPEELVGMVDSHALSPVYSYLSTEDQIALIQRVHSQVRSSVVMVDEIKGELSQMKKIGWYGVNCANYGMLHSYSTVIRTEKGMWVPGS
jgi:GTP cyclohydrolase I